MMGTNGQEKKKVEKKFSMIIAFILTIFGILGLLGWVNHKKDVEGVKRRKKDEA